MPSFTIRPLALFTSLGLAASLSLSALAAESLQDVMKRRNLSPQDLLAAAKTYVPTAKRDEFIAFSSGGQSGQVLVYGIPSMRILKYIAVFTPEPWQGYGYDEGSKAVLKEGWINGREITWGDSHHPAMSETQATIDQVIAYITSVNYRDFPDVVSLMEDAVDQLNKTKDARAKAEDAARKKDWQQATLWAEQIWQYQVKAADIGIRAKTYLEQNGAKKAK
ncbi:MAG: hypothetical protein ACK5JI_09320 [Azonexus sp.]